MPLTPPPGPDLFAATREHDLPPRWDGLTVRWGDWEAETPAFICPPPAPACCPRCGSLARPVHARGYVARSPVITSAMAAAAEAARARLPRSLRHKRPPLLWLRLYAFRCTDCRHDQVSDEHTGQLWDLDPTDYGPEGSTAP